jgi:hypothetical protein
MSGVTLATAYLHKGHLSMLWIRFASAAPLFLVGDTRIAYFLRRSPKVVSRAIEVSTNVPQRIFSSIERAQSSASALVGNDLD